MTDLLPPGSCARARDLDSVSARIAYIATALVRGEYGPGKTGKDAKRQEWADLWGVSTQTVANYLTEAARYIELNRAMLDAHLLGDLLSRLDDSEDKDAVGIAKEARAIAGAREQRVVEHRLKAQEAAQQMTFEERTEAWRRRLSNASEDPALEAALKSLGMMPRALVEG